MDRTLILAHGRFLALLSTVLDRAGVVPASELGDLLAMFAVTVGEEDDEQGQILAVWARLIKDAGEALAEPAP